MLAGQGSWSEWQEEPAHPYATISNLLSEHEHITIRSEGPFATKHSMLQVVNVNS